MRLKGQLNDPEAFMRIIQSMQRMSTRCILRFSKENVQVAIPRGIDAVEAFASLDDIDEVFCNGKYRVESNFNDQINLEVATEALVSALRSADKLSAVVIKLAKDSKARAILLIVIEKDNHSGVPVSVSHEVFIQIKRPSEMQIVRTAEQALDQYNYNVTVKMPDIAEMRTVAERMRTVDTKNDSITIGINQVGELKLSLHADEINIESKWHGLEKDEVARDLAIANGLQNIAATDPRRKFKSARVDLKALVRLLSCPLVKYHGEAWIENRKVATFLLHVQRNGVADPDKYFGHMMINLPALSSGDDY